MVQTLALIGLGALVCSPVIAQAQPRTGVSTRLRALVLADDSASFEVVRVVPGAELDGVRRRLSRAGLRPNLRLSTLRRCDAIDPGGWRGAEVTAAFEEARRACALVPPRPRAASVRWFLLRWGTDDDDFKDEAVGFVVLDERSARAWVVEFHWSWFER